MDIVQVTPRFPPAIGGVEEHVYCISRELAKRGHNVTVLTSDEIDRKQVALGEENLEGVQVYRSRLFASSVLRESWFIPEISRKLKRLRIDLVHAHGYRCLSSVQAVYSSHFRNVPSVLTPHGIYPSRSLVNGLAKGIFDKSFGRLLLDLSSTIIALTKHNENLLFKLGASRRKMVTVPNGARVEEYFDLPRSTRILEQLHTDGPILLYVGRIDWNKQVDKIVEALPSVLKDFPSAKLLVVGPDYANCADQLETLAKNLGVENSLVITRGVSRRMLMEYYSVSEVFILPSSYEGFGLSMLEAMCSRIPVIISPSGGPGDILKDRTNALFLKNVNATEISEQVHEILTNRSLRSKIVKNALELVENNYTWEKVVDRLEMVYNQTIAEFNSATLGQNGQS
jgi:glycosyltransferase involved in cell wall biosynthesis